MRSNKAGPKPGARIGTESGARPSESQSLEAAIGSQVRALRKKNDMTVLDLATQADLSIGMLSKIENGGTSASLATLQALARALNVPIVTDKLLVIWR